MVYHRTGSRYLVAFNEPLLEILGKTFIKTEYNPKGEWILPHEREKQLLFTHALLGDPRTFESMRQDISETGDTPTNGFFLATVRRGKFKLLLSVVQQMIEAELKKHRHRYRNTDIF